MNFIPPDFQNRFNGKHFPQLHLTSYLLDVPVLHDKPVALKAMFIHSLVGDVITWYHELVRDHPEASYRDMFKKFVTHHHAKKPQSISLGELVALKQRPDEGFT
ncbi:hypothetical protein AMTR_s00151p00064440 [Amborella trichopoda]|uniref:Retrotransposon gag domain-containing protein n=1 Tax=Amborella trichopoda TaxID=13333 RepID=W1NJ57_AMBTC|nr:hypothetical protein AMTR_s00151p00064440 [Amborella trichopoda]